MDYSTNRPILSVNLGSVFTRYFNTRPFDLFALKISATQNKNTVL